MCENPRHSGEVHFVLVVLYSEKEETEIEETHEKLLVGLHQKQATWCCDMQAVACVS